MKISVSASIIQEALRVVARCAPPTLTGNVTLESNGKRLLLKSASDTARCVVLIPGSVSGEAMFAIPIDALRDATKGREDLELTLEKSMLVVKGGRYQTKLSTVDAIATDDIEASDKDAATWKLNPDQAKWLKTAVAQVSLKSNVSIESFMPVSVKLSSKAAFVSCYDNNHMAFVSSKDIQGDLDVTLPLDTFNAVLDVFNELECQITVTKAALKVKNKVVNVTLSLPDQEGQEVIAIDSVIEKAKEAMKTEGKAIVVGRSEIQKFLENAKSVATKERSEISVTTEVGKLNLGVVTTSGSSKTTIKADVKAKLKFAVDYEFFSEAVAKGTEELNIKVVADAFLMISGKTSHNVMALNQESATASE